MSVMTMIFIGVQFEQAELKIIKQNGEELEFMVELADTPELRRLGLMFRTKLAENAGMFMDFGYERIIGMWMKNTLIPLDMLFADAQGNIFLIAENARPLSLEIISSQKPGRYVLEIPGGSAKRLGITPGDKIRLCK